MNLDFGDYIPIFCGCCILLWVFIRLHIKRKRCNLKVYAKCVEHKKHHKKIAYSPVYEITWKGEVIRIDSGAYINKVGKIRPLVGEELWINVNPENPLDFFSPHVLQDEFAPILVAIIFIFIPVYFNFFM